ncbi:DUF2218 domain-containing protein [Caulobacter sp. NIBR1757]|uniref:DUF2218 domain-containing protein n=1 Tax=Caulobacter sp. NIBR1757 TaxID=3016000 RepID=UPI0022F06F42|nr:DUF2218 domain-containing protein [Caulobacter sp. NIBR1757]WGM38502.1 hypothetical protein AMEJIAPC_01405 [Caulobacter sp. NIBR1757]
MDSHARFATDKAVRYMTQLGKHWSHKFPVLLGEADCEIDLPIGRCVMRADGEGLDITATAEGPEGLSKLEDVIASHLARFAFREGEVSFGWTRAWPAGSIDISRMRA